MCEPIRFDEHGAISPNLNYLLAATKLFVAWKNSGCSGLTDQTFLACIQTMTAIRDLAQYLHQKLQLSYILPGKFTSDPIEGRFGWYRQANGGNFYMSIKQLMEAEKKIRTLSLYQQQGIQRASSLNAQSHVALPSGEYLDDANDETDSGTKHVTEFLLTSAVSLDDISETDANVAYYVSGFIARSISRRRKCLQCKTMLMKSDEPPPLPICDSQNHANLFEIADRGGLSVPSEFCFAVTVLAVQCYAAIIANQEAKSKMMTVSNQRSAFISAVTTFVKQSCDFQDLPNNICSEGHSNFKLILQTVFNCFAKNELKRLNAPSTAPALMVTARKIRKLTSCSSTNTAT